MNWRFILISLLVTLGHLPAAAMQINVDPRMIISSMDKSVPPGLDILRVTTSISEDNRLVFQVKTRGEWTEGQDDEYLLLQILNEKVYVLLIPINKGKGSEVLMYENAFQPESLVMSQIFRESNEHDLQHNLQEFNSKYISRGAEFTVPIEWINFSSDFGFDAYTVKASMQGDTLEITRVYDQARKDGEEKRFSAITLLNKICSPQRSRSSQ